MDGNSYAHHPDDLDVPNAISNAPDRDTNRQLDRLGLIAIRSPGRGSCAGEVVPGPAPAGRGRGALQIRPWQGRGLIRRAGLRRLDRVNELELDRNVIAQLADCSFI